MGRKEGNKLVFNALSTMTVISGREKDQTDRDRWGVGRKEERGLATRLGHFDHSILSLINLTVSHILVAVEILVYYCIKKSSDFRLNALPCC